MIRAAALGLVLLVASCAGGGDDVEEAFRDAHPQASEEQSECVVELLRQVYGPDELERQLADADPSADFEARQLDAFVQCGLTDDLAGDLAASFAAANDVDLAVARCVVDDLLAELGGPSLIDELRAAVPSDEFARQQVRALFACGETEAIQSSLEAQLIEQGTAPSDAPCVARELADSMSDSDLDVLFSGEIDDSFFATFLEAQRACGTVTG